MKITATVNEAKNGFHIPSGHNKAVLKDWMKTYKCFEITPVIPESRQQRGFYHGAICALYAFFHDTLDHRDNQHIKTVHEWLKLEYNGEYVVIGGKSHLVGKTTKQKLSTGFLERCIEGLVENYGLNEEVLSTDRYKNWRDTVYPHGGPSNYIDYLVEIGLLKNHTGVQ